MESENIIRAVLDTLLVSISGLLVWNIKKIFSHDRQLALLEQQEKIRERDRRELMSRLDKIERKIDQALTDAK